MGSLIPSEKKLAKLKSADFALFASNWWPKAEFNELRIVTFLAIWLFLWDDELDEPTGVHADNFETAERYRDETVQFLENSLGLGSSQEEPPTASHATIDSFREIGQKLKVAYTVGKGGFSSSYSIQLTPI